MSQNHSKKLAITITISITVVLIIAIIVLYPYYNKENEDVREAYKNSKVILKINGELQDEYTIEQLSELVAPVEFNAVYKPNGKLPLEKTYTGLYFKDVLEALGIDVNTINGVCLKASDGLSVTYSKSQILEENSMYIAYKVNGKPFNTSRLSNAYDNECEDGGPLVVILAKEPTSQHRTKWLAEINIL